MLLKAGEKTTKTDAFETILAKDKKAVKDARASRE